jgi:hypothetical protein
MAIRICIGVFVAFVWIWIYFGIAIFGVVE